MQLNLLKIIYLKGVNSSTFFIKCEKKLHAAHLLAKF